MQHVFNPCIYRYPCNDYTCTTQQSWLQLFSPLLKTPNLGTILLEIFSYHCLKVQQTRWPLCNQLILLSWILVEHNCIYIQNMKSRSPNIVQPYNAQHHTWCRNCRCCLWLIWSALVAIDNKWLWYTLFLFACSYCVVNSICTCHAFKQLHMHTFFSQVHTFPKILHNTQIRSECGGW